MRQLQRKTIEGFGAEIEENIGNCIGLDFVVVLLYLIFCVLFLCSSGKVPCFLTTI